MSSSTHSFGEQLRAERERRDVPLHDIADATKIRVRYLEALEQGEHDRLPGFVFAKGYVRAYAETIGADADRLVDAYVAEQQQLGRVEETQNEAVLEALAAAVEPTPASAGRWKLWAALTVALVAIVAAVMLWPSATPADNPPQAATQVQTPVEATVEATPTPEPIAPIIEATPQPEPEPEPEPIKEEPIAVVQDSGMQVSEFGVGTDVRSRVLVGESDRFSLGGALVFWNRVIDGSKGDAIQHVWSLNGQPVRTIELAIGGPHWRTYSRMTPRESGEWTVEAIGVDGSRLAARSFTVED